MEDRNAAKQMVRRRIRELAKIVNSEFNDKELLINKVDEIFDEYMETGGLRPVIEIPNELEFVGRLLVKTHENIERITAYKRTREQWEKIEKQFIPPKPKEVPEGYRVCACWNCNKIFKRNGKKKYCSDECAQEQMDANKRLKKTGTYLAPKRDGYISNREENTGKKDISRVIYTDDIDKYFRTNKTGNRPHSPNRNPDKPAKKEKLNMGKAPSKDAEKKKRYEAFIRGEIPGIFTVNIRSGFKVYHSNGKKHDISEDVQALARDV